MVIHHGLVALTMLKSVKSKKGVSGIVETMILIGLTVAVVAIVWAIVNNLVQKNISESESCFGIFGKVSLNSQFTCYNNTLGTDEVWFSIDIGDLDVSDILVGISGGGDSVTFKIGDNVSELSYYPGRTQPVSVPGKNSGKTYIYRLPSGFPAPEKVEIAPIIDDQICSTGDSIDQIDNCLSIVS